MIPTSFVDRIPREGDGGIVDIAADLSGLVEKVPDLGSKKLKF